MIDKIKRLHKKYNVYTLFDGIQITLINLNKTVRMRKCLFSLLAICSILFSCKSISVNQQPQILTERPVELGAIGLLHTNMMQKSFENVAIPTFKQELKLYLQPVVFSKQTFKAYEKANNIDKKLEIVYNDSIKGVSKYIHLQFLDRVDVTSQLNKEFNVGVRSYLESKEKAQMITSVAIALNESDIQTLTNASEVFLQQSSSKKFSIQLRDKEGNKNTFELSKGVVFAYQVSGFCWKENDKHDLIIADIANDAEGCPKETYRKASKAVQQEDYYKL